MLNYTYLRLNLHKSCQRGGQVPPEHEDAPGLKSSTHDGGYIHVERSEKEAEIPALDQALQ